MPNLHAGSIPPAMPATKNILPHPPPPVALRIIHIIRVDVLWEEKRKKRACHRMLKNRGMKINHPRHCSVTTFAPSFDTAPTRDYFLTVFELFSVKKNFCLRNNSRKKWRAFAKSFCFSSIFKKTETRGGGGIYRNSQKKWAWPFLKDFFLQN